jgi:hypothetical protein
MGEWVYNSFNLDLGTRWSRIVSFMPGSFIPGGKAGTHWAGDWVDPRIGLDAVEKRIFCLCRKSNPGSSA